MAATESSQVALSRLGHRVMTIAPLYFRYQGQSAADAAAIAPWQHAGVSGVRGWPCVWPRGALSTVRSVEARTAGRGHGRP